MKHIISSTWEDYLENYEKLNKLKNKLAKKLGGLGESWFPH